MAHGGLGNQKAKVRHKARRSCTATLLVPISRPRGLSRKVWSNRALTLNLETEIPYNTRRGLVMMCIEAQGPDERQAYRIKFKPKTTSDFTIGATCDPSNSNRCKNRNINMWFKQFASKSIRARTRGILDFGLSLLGAPTTQPIHTQRQSPIHRAFILNQLRTLST